MKNMTQEQAIQRGFTHFIEVWNYYDSKEGCTDQWGHNINIFDSILEMTKHNPQLYTVAIFLIKPKHPHA
jgi:hypothetical protein